MIDAIRDTPPTRNLLRGNAADQIFGDLRDAIVSGQLVRGARLPTEKQLAEQYGVSGPTIREAVRGLTTARLIEVRHGSGAYVTAEADQLLAVSLNAMIQMERVGVPELLGVLGALHAYAAERSALKASDEDIARMQDALAAMETASTARAIPDALIEFLGVLANASDNALLAVLCRFLTKVQVDLTTELSGGTLAGWRKTALPMTPLRQKLVDAIRARNPKDARAAAQAYHLKSIEVIGALPRAKAAPLSDPSHYKILASLLQRSAM